MRFDFKISLIYVFLLSLFLLTCQKKPTDPQGIKDIYPLAVGNYWLYTNSDGSNKIQDEIIGHHKLYDSLLVYIKRKITTSKIFKENTPLSTISETTFSYLSIESNELREILDTNIICYFSIRDSIIYCTNFHKILLGYPLELGDSWSTFSPLLRNYYCLIDCSLCEIDSVMTLENISLPLGQFNDCYKIVTKKESFCGSYVDEIRWFLPYVGIVKLAPAGQESLAFTLREYRVVS